MDDVAISARGLSKRYEVFSSPRGRLLHALWPGYRRGVQEVWALRDVELDVRRGESVAVIGRNGSGKSSLLQILTGVLAPSAGEVRVNGRVSALLELGSGFNPEYTGRDNVILNGLLMGLEREEIVARFGEIAAFAEIGEAIDRPVATYSSGMLMRLAFAVQVLVEPEILVIDEALSVGDFFFQQKCFKRIRELSEKGVTLLFVSHDMGTVRDLCGRAIYLREGRVEFAGETRLAIHRYLAEQGGAPADRAPFGAAAQETARREELDAIVRDAVWRRGSQDPGPGRIIAVALYDESGAAATSFPLGSTLCVKVAYRPAASRPTHVSAVITNKYNQVVSVLGSSRLQLEPPAPDDDGAPSIFEMRVALQLEAGNYSIMVALANLVTPNRGENVDATDPIGPVAVTWDYEKDLAPFLGMVGLAAQGSFRRVAAAEDVNG